MTTITSEAGDVPALLPLTHWAFLPPHDPEWWASGEASQRSDDGSEGVELTGSTGEAAVQAKAAGTPGSKQNLLLTSDGKETPMMPHAMPESERASVVVKRKFQDLH